MVAEVRRQNLLKMASMKTLDITLSLQGKEETFNVSKYTEPGFLFKFAVDRFGSGTYTFMFLKGSKTPYIEGAEVEKVVLEALKCASSEEITDRFHDSAKLVNNQLSELVLQVKKQRCSKEFKGSRKSTALAVEVSNANDRDGMFNANHGHRASSKSQVSIDND